MSSPDLNLPEILAFAIDLAKQAGAKIKKGSEDRFKNSAASAAEKKNSVDLVTETDQAVERFVIEVISKTYPEHKFVGEESVAAGILHRLGDEPTWIVDPIDGTTNFIHGFPHTCISIGFAHLGKPVVGVIYNPFLDQLYSAAKGHGAYLNQSIKLPMASPALDSLSQALIGVEWGVARSPEMVGKRTRSFANLVGQEGAMVHGLRSYGSAALNFAAVAAGSLDAYWEIGCYEWDVCAGICLLEEAGGMCFGAKDKPLDGDINPAMLTGRKYLAIRGIPNGKETQKRLAKEFYDLVEDWDP